MQFVRVFLTVFFQNYVKFFLKNNTNNKLLCYNNLNLGAFMEYRIATIQDLEIIWNNNIAKHPDDERWVRWKKQYIEDNLNGRSITFVVVNDNTPIGEITMVISNEHKDVVELPQLCDGTSTVYMCAFRIEKEYEGKGYISKLVKYAETYAKNMGRKYAIIGVNAANIRNMQIYFHFGYTNFLFANEEKDRDKLETVLFYKKEL